MFQALFQVLGIQRGAKCTKTFFFTDPVGEDKLKTEILYSKYVTCTYLYMMRNDLKREPGSAGRGCFIPPEHMGIRTKGLGKNQKKLSPKRHDENNHDSLKADNYDALSIAGREN